MFFGTTTINDINIYYSKFKMLLNIYQVLEEDICQTSPSYNKLRKQHIEIVDMLEQSFTKGQQTLFEKQFDIGSDMIAVENEQMFIFGYIMAKTLDTDIKIDKLENK